MPRKRSTKRSAKRVASADQTQRLQRFLASAGYGSRRQCEELIETGRVMVDDATVTQLGTTVDPAINKVRVDGVLLKKQKLVYFAVNKPVGVVTTRNLGQLGVAPFRSTARSRQLHRYSGHRHELSVQPAVYGEQPRCF